MTCLEACEEILFSLLFINIIRTYKRSELPNFFMQVFIACGLSNSDGKADPFRKPKPGMWQIMEKHFNSGIPIDMDQLFSSSVSSFQVWLSIISIPFSSHWKVYLRLVRCDLRCDF